MDWVMWIELFAKSLILILTLLGGFAYLTWLERRVLARMQTRIGPNRAGPFGLLNLVDERCGGRFDNIDDVIPPDERHAFMADYKAAAGFAMETLNRAPPTIARGARAAGAVEAAKTIGAI